MNEQDRFDRVEEEVAHLRLANEEMSQELVVHLKKIEALENLVRMLETRFKGIEDELTGPVENEKPPHW